MEPLPGEIDGAAALWPDAVARLAASQRVLILGPSGAGKSRLARQLGSLLQLPVQHLDAHFWQPGWRVSKPPSEWRPYIETLTREPRWIMDGTYERTLDVRVPPADSVVIIERGRVTCLWRSFRRAVFRRGVARPDAPPGERFTVAFVRYIWRYPRETRPMIARALSEHGAGKTIIALRTPSDTGRLLRALEDLSSIPRVS
jgi:adenylate kinase family enzyme